MCAIVDLSAQYADLAGKRRGFEQFII